MKLKLIPKQSSRTPLWIDLGRKVKTTMNFLPRTKQEHIVHLLLEGCSIRSVNRLTGVHRNTITSLLLRSGERS